MFEDENIIEMEEMEIEIEETPKKPNPPIWYAMTDGAGKIIDIRSSEQIYPVNPDVWHELSGVAYGEKVTQYDEDGNEIEDNTQYISRLYDENNVFMYKLENGGVIERTETERKNDIPKAAAVSVPSTQDITGALANVYYSMFDGLKLVADRLNPLKVELPFPIKPNMFYEFNGKLYVGLKDGIATKDNFDEYFAADEIE